MRTESDRARGKAAPLGRCSTCGVKPVPLYDGDCLRCRLENDGIPRRNPAS